MLGLFDNRISNPQLNVVRSGIDRRIMDSLVSDRVRHLSMYMLMVGLLWGASGSYILLKRGFLFAVFPLGISAIIFFLAWIDRQKSVSRKNIINAFLVANVTGLIVAACISEMRESTLQFHFPVVSLMALQLRGMKAAITWFFVSILAIALTLFFPFLPNRVSYGNTLDHLASATVLSCTILWLCYQAERCFANHTRQLRQLTDSLAEKTRLLGLAEETASIGYWRWDVVANSVVFSDELVRICGVSNDCGIDELVERFDSASAATFGKAIERAANEQSTFAFDLTIPNDNGGTHLNCRGFSELGQNENVEAVFGIIRDETKLRVTTQRLYKKAEELNELACIDPLTGLANRLSFRSRLSSIIADAVENRQLMALVVLDMDGFKEINDTLGHSVGDLVLIETAKRITNAVRQDDVVSRLGGDEYTVILKNPGSVEKALATSQRIVNAIRAPIQLDTTKVQVGASVGVSICPADSSIADELFTYADTAMYEAKFNSKDVVLYEPSMTDELVQRKQLESQLSKAVVREEFSMMYQPQYNVYTREIVGFEALIRWNRDGKLISPVEFIPVLESSGQIIETSQWIFERVCQQLAQWRELGVDTRIAVNISPLQFKDPKFYFNIVETLNRFNIPANCIDLEITEGAIICDVNHTANTLAKLKSLGCVISIDDFGTGYSSLAYLRNFPIDTLKIDRTFIRDIPKHDDGTIASSIVVLGLSLGLDVLAEGVETEAQLSFLADHGCQYFQGFLGSKPLSADDCLKLIEEQRVKNLKMPEMAE